MGFLNLQHTIHNDGFRIAHAVFFELIHITFERLRLDNRAIVTAVHIAAKPDRDIFWIGYLVKHKLIAGDL